MRYLTNSGIAALPPRAKVYTVPGPCRSVARCASPYTPPQPTAIDTYCAPSTRYVEGAATTPVPVAVSQSFSPVLALYAMNRPSAVPWKTRFPAVVRVPPFHGDTCSWRHASRRCTGSQAMRRPNGLLVGGWTLANMARFHPRPPWGSPGLLPPIFQSLLSIRLSGTFCAGRYTSPVRGLNDIGCQLWAPKGPGMLS